MTTTTIADLVRLAAALATEHRELLTRARALGVAHGVEVLDVRPAGADGTWDVQLRLLGPHTDPSEAAMHPCGAADEPPDPAFDSPVRRSQAFDGDGTNDVLRFVAESDRSVCVPGQGGARGAAPAPLSAEERLTLLPTTIAGDAILSLQHQGRHLDGDAVDAALRQARRHYVDEVERVGPADPDRLLGLFDHAAATARGQLLGAAA